MSSSLSAQVKATLAVVELRLDSGGIKVAPNEASKPAETDLCRQSINHFVHFPN